MVGFEKVLEVVKAIKDQIQYRSQSLLKLARGYFRTLFDFGSKVRCYRLVIRLSRSKS